MTPDEICRHAPRLLSEESRRRYFDDGGLVVPAVVDAGWLERCRAAVARLQQQSARLTQSDAVFDLEPGHRQDNPRLRRISSPCDQDPVFWELLTEGPLGGLAMDLLGPNVKFYQAKLNFKSPKGGTEVRWHQDQPFFPHTNHAVLTMGVYLEDCSLDHGPLEIVPGSHAGEIFDHHDAAGEWRGEISADDSGLELQPTIRQYLQDLDGASFETADGPVTVPELLTLMPALAQSSAYRNLALMEEAGVVRRLVHGNDHARYELAEALTEHHHHLICESCGVVRDVQFDERLERALDRTFDEVASAEGFTVGRHAIDVFGVCADCA